MSKNAKINTRLTNEQIGRVAYKYDLNHRVLIERYWSNHGLCELCRERVAIVADHNHSTGDFRGFLCHYCNCGLGFFQDRPRLLAAAIIYLEDYGAEYSGDDPDDYLRDMEPLWPMADT